MPKAAFTFKFILLMGLITALSGCERAGFGTSKKKAPTKTSSDGVRPQSESGGNKAPSPTEQSTSDSRAGANRSTQRGGSEDSGITLAELISGSSETRRHNDPGRTPGPVSRPAPSKFITITGEPTRPIGQCVGCPVRPVVVAAPKQPPQQQTQPQPQPAPPAVVADPTPAPQPAAQPAPPATPPAEVAPPAAEVTYGQNIFYNQFSVQSLGHFSILFIIDEPSLKDQKTREHIATEISKYSNSVTQQFLFPYLGFIVAHGPDSQAHHARMFDYNVTGGETLVSGFDLLYMFNRRRSEARIKRVPRPVSGDDFGKEEREALRSLQEALTHPKQSHIWHLLGHMNTLRDTSSFQGRAGLLSLFNLLKEDSSSLTQLRSYGFFNPAALTQVVLISSQEDICRENPSPCPASFSLSNLVDLSKQAQSQVPIEVTAVHSAQAQGPDLLAKALSGRTFNLTRKEDFGVQLAQSAIQRGSWSKIYFPYQEGSQAEALRYELRLLDQNQSLIRQLTSDSPTDRISIHRQADSAYIQVNLWQNEVSRIHSYQVIITYQPGTATTPEATRSFDATGAGLY